MSEGIPDHLSDAFRQAIVVCHDWSGDDREPPIVSITWDPTREAEPQHPEFLCSVISNFTDEMPSEVASLLASLPYNIRDIVGSDRSCLLEFIKLKREMYERDR